MKKPVYILESCQPAGQRMIVEVGDLEPILYRLSYCKGMHPLDYEYRFNVDRGFELTKTIVGSRCHMNFDANELLDEYGYVWYLQQYTNQVYKVTKMQYRGNDENKYGRF